MSLKVKPKRDRRRPFRFRASGKVIVSGTPSCLGRITVTVRRGGRRVLRKRVGVRFDCTYRTTLKLKRKAKKGRYRVSARFGGNAGLTSATSRTRRVRAG